MKILKYITASILLCLLPAYALNANSFKDGNSSYLQGDYTKALEAYSKFIKDKPKFFEGYYNAGNALYRQEQYEDALKMYNKSLELNPKDEDTKINIQVTEDKIKKQEENKDKKDNKNNKDNKDNKQDKGKDGKDKGNQQGKGQDNKGKGDKGQEQKGQQGKGGQADKNKQNSGAGQGQQKTADKADPQKELGMSADEVQALMNMAQKSEKDYKNYFGKQYRHKQNENDFPNVFNMSPEEIHNYMMKQMMEPNEMQQAPPKGNSKEKDW
jgi:tetratricopeptide (TPR) repeat protein